jgi:hypothetical protein
VPITDATAHFLVEPLAFSDAEAMRRMTELENGNDDAPAVGESASLEDGSRMDSLSAAQKRAYCFMPSATLYEELGLIRMMHAEVYAPAKLLAGLIHKIRYAGERVAAAVLLFFFVVVVVVMSCCCYEMLLL